MTSALGFKTAIRVAFSQLAASLYNHLSAAPETDASASLTYLLDNDENGTLMERSQRTWSWRSRFVAAVVHITHLKYLRKCFKSSGSVIFVSSRICIKVTANSPASEAHAMDFVRRNTAAPVPKVYFAGEYKGRGYLVMQRMKGTPLTRTWHPRSEKSKQRIVEQLKSFVNELRQLPAPVDIGVCGIDLGPIYDPRLPRTDHWGPFRTIRDFHLALLDGNDFTDCPSEKYPDLRDLASFYNLEWDRSVFTHGDLSSFNILCNGDQVVGIIDWETVGWFPSYWELVNAWNVNPQNTFWQKEINRFLEPLPYAREMDSIRRKYFGFC